MGDLFIGKDQCSNCAVRESNFIRRPLLRKYHVPHHLLCAKCILLNQRQLHDARDVIEACLSCRRKSPVAADAMP
eukprot:1147399-Pyramimonas_sp.AAC.1